MMGSQWNFFCGAKENKIAKANKWGRGDALVLVEG
jgi:hypothetical protein